MSSLSALQKAVVGVLALAAIAGWVVAILVWFRAADVAERLAAAETRMADTSDKLAAADDRLQRQQAAAGSLNEISDRTDRARGELAALEVRLRSGRRQHKALTTRLEAAKVGLDGHKARVEAAREELAAIELKIEGARAELERLESDVARGQRSARQLASRRPTGDRAASPRGPAAAPAEASVKSSADERFMLADENGDGRIDRAEFNLTKVRLLDLGDLDRDGFVTPNESLLSPAAFAQFDQDGDGKISTLEFVDARAFDLIDANRDGAISMEEVRRITQR